MLKWERADEDAGTDPALRARADRWIVFLFLPWVYQSVFTFLGC
jgi:hypothetical protein